MTAEMAELKSQSLRLSLRSRTTVLARRLAVIFLIGTTAMGCTSALMPRGKSPLVAPQLSPDSAVFDVVIVRVPYCEQAAAENLWKEIDEQQLPADLRARLARNGFRAGVVGSTLPMELSRLLDPKAEAPPPGAGTTIVLSELGQPPRNEHRHMPIRSGRRGEVIASATYDQLPVLVRTDDGVCGQTYFQAQAVLAVTPTLLPDGRVKIEVVPELHHDQPRQRWVGENGVLRLEAGRPRRVFDDLTASAVLSPGEMFILGCVSDRPGSLGHNFFSDTGEQPSQKLIIFRLIQTQHSGLYSPPEEKPTPVASPATVAATSSS